MNILLDVFTNLSFVIIICISLIDKKMRNDSYTMSDVAGFATLASALPFPILIITGHGNLFIVILTQFIYSIFAGFMIYDFLSYYIIHKIEFDLVECIYFFIMLAYCIGGIYGIFFRIKSEKEYLINLFNKIKSIHYKEMFLELINNNWFQGICVGIISAVVGGLVLNKIVSRKNKDKDAIKDKKDN